MNEEKQTSQITYILKAHYLTFTIHLYAQHHNYHLWDLQSKHIQKCQVFIPEVVLL